MYAISFYQSISADSNYFSKFGFKLLDKINPNHLLNNFLKPYTLYQRYYSTKQSPRVHMWVQKSLIKGL
jgi:hypothetical protein